MYGNYGTATGSVGVLLLSAHRQHYVLMFHGIVFSLIFQKYKREDVGIVKVYQPTFKVHF